MGSKRVISADVIRGVTVTPNFLSTSDAEPGGSPIGSIVAYADAAATSPVDGSGGSPASTIAVSADTSLIGTSNFLWTKSAANRQGEGWSQNFSIDSAYQSKPMTISALYKVASGTYADNDVSVWVYDLTNAVLIQPSAYQIKNTTGVEQLKCEFQASSNSTSYRLIFHTASTSALAYTLRFDALSISPNTYNSGAGITDWVAYTPTFTGVGTASNVSFRSRRVGGNLEVQGYFVTGTVTAANVAISLGYGGVSGNVTTSSTLPSGGQIVGSGGLGLNTASSFTAIVTPSVTTFGIGFPSASSTAVSFTPGTSLGTGNVFEIFLSTPIQGWGTSQVLSSETASNVVGMLALGPSISQSSGDFVFSSVVRDTSGMYNSSTGVVTIPVSGLYNIKAEVTNNSTGTGQTNGIDLFKNGSTLTDYGGFVYSKSASDRNLCKIAVDNLPLVAGDQIKVRVQASAAGTFNGNLGTPFFSVQRVSGPAQIAASEKIYLQYTGNAGTVLTAGTTNLDFTNKVVDSHGAWNGSVFTAPRPGWYDVKGSALATTSGSRDLFIYVGGVSQPAISGAYVSTNVLGFSGGAYLLAGQQMSIRTDVGYTLSNSATLHAISITSQG